MLDFLPIRKWMKDYNRVSFSQDCIAGIVVTITLVPQSMAYALLAGVPAVYGLYCAIIPTLLYCLLGSSRHNSVAPAALISIMVASSVGSLQPESEAQYLYYVTVSSFLTGCFLLIMRLLRLGAITHYISTPVINGFTSAAAIIIATSQIKHIIGINIPNGLTFIETLQYLFTSVPTTNISVLLLSIICFTGLWLFKTPWSNWLARLLSQGVILQMLKKSGPLIVILLAALSVSVFSLDADHAVPIVGEIPKGFPQWQWFTFDFMVVQALIFPSFLIALMCFITSVAVGNNLAAKRKEKLNPDQELLALGVANVSSAFFGSFALAASLSRTAVNYNAGSQTSIAGIISAIGVLMTLLWLTPLFYSLPLAALGVIVIMSVISMIEIRQITYYWQINRADALTFAVTFLMVLIFGIEIGLGAGIVYSIILLIRRTSHPHIAVVGRIEGSEHFRNIERHQVFTSQHVLTIRVDENLYFANSDYVENYILERCKQQENIKHLVLICSSVSFVDVNALEMFESLLRKLKQHNITLHLAEVKGPVMDQIKKSNLLDDMLPGKVFLTTDQAVSTLEEIIPNS